MTDFVGAFEEGLNAAKEAASNQAEIREMILQLNGQISKASNHSLLLQMVVDSLAALRKIGLPGEDEMESPPRDFIIEAINPKMTKSPSKELARLTMARSGYPCTVSWGGEEHYCNDRDGLEECLASLLRDPVTGSILHKLMSMKPDSQDQAAQKQENAQQEE